jgi:hypothetical protein
MNRIGIESDDIHNIERRYQNALRLLNASRKIIPLTLTYYGNNQNQGVRQVFSLTGESLLIQ